MVLGGRRESSWRKAATLGTSKH